MSRLIDQPIQVTVAGGKPVSFVWRGARFRVTAIMDTWAEGWEQEPPATAWRVQVHDKGEMELLMLHKQPSEWRLMKVWD